MRLSASRISASFAFASRGIGGEPERHPEPRVDALLLQERVALDQPAQLLREHLRRVAVGLRQDHHELVAAVARRDVGLAHGGADQEADLAQRAAAAQVAVLVVDRLEAVEVHEQQRQRAAVAVDELQLALERLVEVAEVVERRHLVGDRQLARLLEQPHVLERERHRVGERLQPRECRLVERPALARAERQHADRALARA